ncbi:MAG: HEAT repeat domain-containing protein, partial [Limnohabitans sp.]
MIEKEVHKLLAHGLAPHWYKLEAKLINSLANTFIHWYARQETLRNEPDQHLRLAHFLIAQVNDEQQQITQLKLDYGEFTKRFSRGLLPEDKQGHILDYAATLGADKTKLRGDRKAFRRWFGSDAMTDRYLNSVAKTERRLSFCLQRLGVISGLALQNSNNAEAQWQQFKLEELLAPLLTYEGDQRVRIEAFRCLATALQKMPDSIRSQSINDHTLQYVMRAATDPRLHIWIQCEALNLLATLSMTAFTAAVTKRIERPRTGDDLFVRHRAISLLSEHQQQQPSLSLLLEMALQDPSPYVRQAVAEALTKADDATVIRSFPKLLLEDDSPQVRATASLQIPFMLGRSVLFENLCSWQADLLNKEKDPFALKVALMVTSQCMLEPALSEQSERRQKWCAFFSPLVEEVHLNTPSLPTRRFAAMTLEWLWCLSDPRRKQLIASLQNLAQTCQPGKSIHISRKLLQFWDEAEVGRILAIISQNDFGLSLEEIWSGWRLWRGHVFRTRLWRVLHEFRHPSPDKRQAFSHSIGRVFYGHRRAASAILAELAETKVPGEPLQYASEGGWRPYLPLVDEFISALDQTLQVKPVTIHCAEGMTEIIPPSSIIRRIAASLKLTWHFERYARQRNWHEGSQQPPDAYLKSMSDLGFTVKFHAYGKQPEVNVQRFFPAGF